MVTSKWKMWPVPDPPLRTRKLAHQLLQQLLMLLPLHIARRQLLDRLSLACSLLSVPQSSSSNHSSGPPPRSRGRTDMAGLSSSPSILAASLTSLSTGQPPCLPCMSKLGPAMKSPLTTPCRKQMSQGQLTGLSSLLARFWGLAGSV